MKLLAVDPGSTSGWALGERTGVPMAGTWKLPGFDDKNRAKSFAGIYSSVYALCRGNGVEGFVIEAPLRLGGRSAHTERMLVMLSGAAQAGAFNGGVKWVEIVAPQTWRKKVLGNGFPKNPKRAAIEYCNLMRWNIIEHNAAEASCILVYGHGQTRLI